MNKNSTTIILVIIIIAAIVATILIKNNKEPIKTDTLTTSDVQINEAIESDSTVSINAALNKINVEDTSAKDMSEIDAELNNL